MSMQTNQPTQGRRFFLIDPTLKGSAGHNLDYARLVVADAARTGYDCQVWCHSEALFGPDALGAPRRLWFKSGQTDTTPLRIAADRMRRTVGEGAYSLARSVKRHFIPAPASRDEERLSLAASFGEDVEQALIQAAPAPGDRLLFPNLLWSEAVRLCEVLRRIPLPGVDIQVLLRFDPPTTKAAADVLQRVGALAHVRWLSDTEELCAEYRQLLGVDIELVRIPFDGAALREAALRRPRPSVVTVAYLGEARREKGFHLLPSIIAETAGRDPDVRFCVQAAMNKPHGEDGIPEAIAALKRMEGKPLTLLPTQISSEQFIDLVGASHVLLLPYDPSSYRLRSSGLLVQGLAAGLRIVAPGGPSWLSACIRRNAQPDQVVECSATVSGYSDAVIEAARRARQGPLLEGARVWEETLPALWAVSDDRA